MVLPSLLLLLRCPDAYSLDSPQIVRQFILNLQQCEIHQFQITWKTLCKSPHFFLASHYPIVRKTSKPSKSIFTDKCHQSVSFSQAQCCMEVSHLGQTVVHRTAVSIACVVADLDLNCAFLLQMFWSCLWFQNLWFADPWISISSLTAALFLMVVSTLAVFDSRCTRGDLWDRQLYPRPGSLGEDQRDSDWPEQRRLLFLCLVCDAIVSETEQLCLWTLRRLVKSQLMLLPQGENL